MLTGTILSFGPEGLTISLRIAPWRDFANSRSKTKLLWVCSDPERFMIWSLLRIKPNGKIPLNSSSASPAVRNARQDPGSSQKDPLQIPV
jgi:hypothetical protein